MIFEYVIDPDLITKWANSDRDYSDFIDSFGIGTPRLACEFPRLKIWRKLALQKIPFDEPDSLMAQRSVELINAICEARITRRGIEFTRLNDWEDRVEKEDQRIPFDFVFLHDERHLELDRGFKQDDIYKPASRCWKHRTDCVVKRAVSDLADAVGNLLRLSSEIVLVDPYLRVQPSKLNPVSAYIRKSIEGRVDDEKPLVKVLYNIDSKRAPSAEVLYKGIATYIGADMDQIRLVVKSLEEKQGGQEIHNRYILTDLGGIAFGTGLDEGSSTDDLFLMTKETYMKRWSQYGTCRAFRICDRYPTI